MIAKLQMVEQTMEAACKRIDELKAENKALKEALAQPEQEPVAWMDADGERVVTAKQKAGMHESLQASFPVALGYTTPPQRTWVGLTDDEFEDIELGCRSTPFGKIEAMRMVEAKLKEKNQ